MFPGVGSPLFYSGKINGNNRQQRNKKNWILLGATKGIKVRSNCLRFAVAATSTKTDGRAEAAEITAPTRSAKMDDFFSRLNDCQENCFPKNVTVVHVSLAKPVTAMSRLCRPTQTRLQKKCPSCSDIYFGPHWANNNDLSFYFHHHDQADLVEDYQQQHNSSSLVPYPAAWLEIDSCFCSLETQLHNVLNWNFDVFMLNRLSKGQPVQSLGCKLFDIYQFEKQFKLDRTNLLRCLSRIEMGYHSTNPYHCSIHAADVAQALHCFLQESQVKNALSPLDKMACILAAFGHDLYHPGVNQRFLENSQHFLCNLYQDSVLENFHWRCLVGIVRESGLLQALDCRQWRRFIRTLRTLILATDMQKQQEYLNEFQTFCQQMSNKSDLSLDEPQTMTLMQILIKCADIANPCRTWDVSRKWSLRASEEFFNQGNIEKRLSFPVLDSYDRALATIPKVQSGFISYIARPLFKCWHLFINSPLSKSMLDNLHFNYSRWTTMLAAEAVDAKLLKNSSGSKSKRKPTWRSNALSEFINKRRASASLISRTGRRTSLYDEETRRVTLPLVGRQSCSTLWSAASTSAAGVELSSKTVSYQALSIIEDQPEPSGSCIQLSLIPISDENEPQGEETATTADDDTNKEQDDVDDPEDQFVKYTAIWRSQAADTAGRRSSEPIIVHYTNFCSTNSKRNSLVCSAAAAAAAMHQPSAAASSMSILAAADRRLGRPCRRGSLPMTEKEMQILELTTKSTTDQSDSRSHRPSLFFCQPVGV